MGQDVAGWIVGLVVGLTSVILAALLWSSRQLYPDQLLARLGWHHRRLDPMGARSKSSVIALLA